MQQDVHEPALATIALAQVAQRSREENASFIRRQSCDTSWVFELFRRACEKGPESSEAWRLLCEQYRPLIREWIRSSTVGRLVLERESCDDLLWLAVERFALALTSEKLHNFPELKYLLGYWQDCVRTMQIDYLRVWCSKDVVSFERLEQTDEELMYRDSGEEATEHVLAEHLWKFIRCVTTEEEYLLLILSFRYHLKPEHICQMQLIPQLKTNRQVYDRKKTVLDRLARNKVLRSLYQQEYQTATIAS